MKWITREKPKIDRIACPWVIKKFIDPEAEFLYVPDNTVMETARQTGAIPFDIPGVEYTHYDDRCTFDYIIQKHLPDNAALRAMARIIRGADTDRHDIAPQASGLWAISVGMSHIFKDDYDLLSNGMLLYDALYNWAIYFQHERHTQHSTERLLLDVLENYIKKKKAGKKIPAWVKELKHIIQDQVDTSITLKQLSQDLKVHPAYLSREFSKYFDNLSFGDYLRKLRIEKAIEYLRSSDYSLTKIAYLSGFSDQSHFTRIFKKQVGENPSTYRKKIHKKL